MHDANVNEQPCPHCGQPLTPQDIICPFCQSVVVAAHEWKPPVMDRTGVSQESRKGKRGIIWGLLAANISAALLIGLGFALNSVSSSAAGILVSSDFVLVPFVMGLISAFFWKGLKLTTMEYFLYSLLNSAFGLVGGGVFMGEGAICLLIVSPLLITFVFLGALTGRWLFHYSSNRLNLSLIPMAVALMTMDVLSPHHYENAVTDTVVIHASPSQVWTHLAAVPLIPEKPNYWLFQMGLPYPTHSTVNGQGVGALRQCVFSRNCVFQEKIVAWVPAKKLTFDVTSQPRDPEILGHARVRRGQFLLRDNHDGTTTLIGTSWYELYVYPAWYYDLWASSIARQVHLRVMDHIKTLSEQPKIPS
ncbi:MAG: hypothetical protein ACRYFS_09035 [Janthinobacterium lividum]